MNKSTKQIIQTRRREERERIIPCEDDEFCPPQLHHPKCSYTSSHQKLEDRREDCKKVIQEETSLEAPQAD